MIRYTGKVTGLYEMMGMLWASAVVEIGVDSGYQTPYQIPVTKDVKIGDEVILIVSPPSPVVGHPLRRSTDGPAIEGHVIPVVRSITAEDKDREDLDNI